MLHRKFSKTIFRVTCQTFSARLMVYNILPRKSIRLFIIRTNRFVVCPMINFPSEHLESAQIKVFTNAFGCQPKSASLSFLYIARDTWQYPVRLLWRIDKSLLAECQLWFCSSLFLITFPTLLCFQNVRFSSCSPRWNYGHDKAVVWILVSVS